eukprot:SAG31_NODE_523_length_14545_cov_4.805067_11_plen_48_part_00
MLCMAMPCMPGMAMAAWVLGGHARGACARWALLAMAAALMAMLMAGP